MARKSDRAFNSELVLIVKEFFSKPGHWFISSEDVYKKYYGNRRASMAMLYIISRKMIVIRRRLEKHGIHCTLLNEHFFSLRSLPATESAIKKCIPGAGSKSKTAGITNDPTYYDALLNRNIFSAGKKFRYNCERGIEFTKKKNWTIRQCVHFLKLNVRVARPYNEAELFMLCKGDKKLIEAAKGITLLAGGRKDE